MAKKEGSKLWIVLLAIVILGFLYLRTNPINININNNGTGGGANGEGTQNPSNDQSPSVQASCSDTDRTDDSDSQPTIFGICSSSISKTSTPDVCASLTSVSEKSCGTDFTCKSNTISCLKGWSCIQGVCRIPRCEDVINPLDQSYCDIATDDMSGACIFHSATLTVPAHCSN